MASIKDKTRAIKGLLVTGGKPGDFKMIAQVLGNNLLANIYVVGRRGKILGYHFLEEYLCDKLSAVLSYSERFPESYNQKLLTVVETQSNIIYPERTCLFSPEDCPLPGYIATIIPIYGGGERLGNLVLTRVQEKFTDEELVLAEYGALVVGMEVMQLKTERAESDTRKKASVQIALSTLSYSELKAAGQIFKELGGYEGLVVASRVADRAGITRSVLVNALRKLESAGVIKSRSLGMKGTYICILNENLLDELGKRF